MWLAVSVQLLACRGGDDGPEEALATWVAAMNATRSNPDARAQAFALLSLRAQQNLRQRAQTAAQLSGREIKPWEMLAPGRFALRFAFDRGRLRTRLEGDRATVTARGTHAEVAEVPMVREEGRWRVALVLPEPQGPQQLRESTTAR
ncbi:MAG: hypothetical protein Q8Q09_06840 [Deltaproteobacteria bacterium]|nr:hypothetical protein [Deltaproteobacteria bacterium]